MIIQISTQAFKRFGRQDFEIGSVSVLAGPNAAHHLPLFKRHSPKRSWQRWPTTAGCFDGGQRLPPGLVDSRLHLCATVQFDPVGRTGRALTHSPAKGAIRLVALDLSSATWSARGRNPLGSADPFDQPATYPFLLSQAAPPEFKIRSGSCPASPQTGDLARPVAGGRGQGSGLFRRND